MVIDCSYDGDGYRVMAKEMFGNAFRLWWMERS